MLKIGELPDLANSFKLLKISCDLEDVLPDSVLGIAIHEGLKRKALKEIITMVKEQGRDNRKMVVDIIGEELMKQIETLIM